MPGAATPSNRLAAVDPRPGVAKPDPILVIDGLRRSFGGIAAVDIEHLEIERGVITALIGPNGAGKTTLYNLLTGFDQPDEGSWSFEGRKLNGSSPYQIARAGMVRTFQLTKMLPRLTVLENLKLGASHQIGERLWSALFASRWRRQEAEIEARAEEMLERFSLAHMRDELAGTLSGGQRKLLEMARALMSDPTLVMLDEPLAGVNRVLTASLLTHVINLREQGMTVVFIEHNMDVVMDISDWVVVQAQGRVIAEGPPAEIARNDDVIDAYLGRSREPAGPEEDR